MNETKIPKVSLPLTVHIVRHAGESKSKSSVIPLKLVANDDVKLYTLKTTSDSELPDLHPDNTVILYPSDDSVEVDQVDWSPVKNLLVVDSTWTQTRAVLANLQSDKFTKVRLSSNYETSFWRYQSKPASCLATVEAIYLLFRDAFATYTGQFDDLLWFYKYNHDIVTVKSHSKRLPASFK